MFCLDCLLQECKHHLRNEWTLWHVESDTSKNWMDRLKVIESFNTTKGFWRMHSLVKNASPSSARSDYCLFKAGIRPMWEDEINRKGGKWIVYISKEKGERNIDKYWVKLLLAMISERFKTQKICGAILNIHKKDDKISLWTSDTSCVNENYRIGLAMKDILGIRDSQVMLYQHHEDYYLRNYKNVKKRLTIP